MLTVFDYYLCYKFIDLLVCVIAVLVCCHGYLCVNSLINIQSFHSFTSVLLCVPIIPSFQMMGGLPMGQHSSNTDDGYAENYKTRAGTVTGLDIFAVELPSWS